jgi:hypothetical protein
MLNVKNYDVFVANTQSGVITPIILTISKETTTTNTEGVETKGSRDNRFLLTVGEKSLGLVSPSMLSFAYATSDKDCTGKMLLVSNKENSQLVGEFYSEYAFKACNRKNKDGIVKASQMPCFKFEDKIPTTLERKNLKGLIEKFAVNYGIELSSIAWENPIIKEFFEV